MSKLFQQIAPARVGRSVFNLSYEKKFSCDMGQLIPVMCDEVVPGDVFEIANEMIVRLQPLVAPVLHELNVFVHYFFCPYRLLDDSFEDFITGGVQGTDSSTLTEWQPTTYTAGSLWDYFGFPVGVDPDGAYPLAFPRTAYNRVYNEFYRDENLITEVLLTNEDILFRCFQKDYFTSALPWQQRGTAPAFPLSGTAAADFTGSTSIVNSSGGTNSPKVSTSAADNRIMINGANDVANYMNALSDNEVDFSSAGTFDIADMRLAFAIQRWMERNARGGVRYTEFLRAHYGVSPRDDRLDRCEFIGGTRAPVIVSEVLQTSESGTTAQGNMSGHGLAVDRRRVCRYRVQEFGLILGIMSIMPKVSYASQGVNRQWLRRTRYDFYSPEFANLSEQAILEAEIYATGVDAENNTIFGYQGVFDEMRTKHDMVCGDMRSTFNYWHLARTFASAPSLNAAFVTCDGTAATMKRIFADGAEDGFLVSFGNIIRALRPLPVQADPRMFSGA